MDLVDSSFCQVWAANVEAHTEAIDDYGSDPEGLSFGTYQEGQGQFKVTFDIEMDTFSCSSYSGRMVGFQVFMCKA